MKSNIDLIPNPLNSMSLYEGKFDTLPIQAGTNPSADFLLKDYMHPDEIADKSTVELIQTSEQGKFLANRRNRAEDALLSNPNTEEGIRLAKEIMAEPAKTPTVGEMFSKTINTPDAVIAADTHYLVDDSKKELLNSLGWDDTMDYDTYMGQVFPEIQAESSSILDRLLSGEATRKAVAEYVSNPSVGILGTAQGIAGVELGLIKDQIVKNSTIKDMLAYASLTPIDAKAEIDFKNMAKVVFSTEGFQERADRLAVWDQQMRTKYDEDYYYQLAAFMAKEGVIEGVPLALALRNPTTASRLLAKPDANLWGRLGAVMKRAAFVGVSGGAIQAGINSYVYDDPNLGTEVFTRALASGAVEGILGGGRLIKGAVGGAIKAGIKVFKPELQPLVGVVDQTAITSMIDELSPLASTSLTKQPSLLELSYKAVDNEGSITPYKGLSDQIQAKLSSQMTPVGNSNASEVLRAMSGGERSKLEEDIISLGFTDRVIGDVTARQEKVSGILDLYLDNQFKTVDYRPTKLKSKVDRSTLGTWFLDPEQYLGDVAKDAFDVYNLTALHRKGLSKAASQVFKDIKADNIDKVYNVRLQYESEAADALGNTGVLPDSSPVSLMARGLNEEEIDAFYALDKLSRFSIIQADKLAVASARANGNKMWNNKLVRVTGETEDGQLLIEEVTKSRAQQAFKGAVPREHVTEVERMAGFIPYHTPRRPENAKWHISIIDPATGTIRRTHAISNLTDTKRTFAEVSKDAQGKGEIAFYDKWNVDEESYHFGVGDESLKLIDAMDAEGVQRLRDALLNSGRSESEIDNMFLSFDRTSKGTVVSRKIIGQRSKSGLLGADGKKAAYKPANEAFSEYMLQVSALPKSDFKRHVVRRFMSDFSSVLDPNLPWTQKILNVAGKEDMVRSARLHQSFIRDTMGQPTPLDKAYNNAWDGIINKMSDQGGFGKGGIGKFLETTPILNKITDMQELSKFLRLNTSRIIFYGNVKSFLSQTIPSVVTNVGARAFTNPAVISQGFTDMIQAAGAKSLSEVRSNVSKEGLANLNALRKSGYMSEIDVTDMADALSGIGARLDKYGMFFIKNGEVANRAMSFFMARREITAQFNEGKLLGINGKPFAGKIDDVEFLRLVTDRSQKLALNMTPAARLRIARGVGSVLAQYYSAPIKMANLVISDKLPAKERMSIAVTSMTLFGPAAIPLAGDVLWGADAISWAATGQDDIDNRQLLTSTVKGGGQWFADSINKLDIPESVKKLSIDIMTGKGAVSSLTDDQVNLVNMVTVSAMVREQLGSLEQDPYNAFPALSIIKKIANESGNLAEYFDHWYAANEIYLNSDNVPLSDQELSLMTPYQRKKEATAILIGQLMNSSGKVVPMMGYIADIANNIGSSRYILNPELKDYDAGKFVTRSGVQIGSKDVEPKDLLSLPFGISPKIKRDASEKFNDEQFWTDTVKSIEDSLMDHYKNARGYEAKQRVLSDIVDQAYKVEDALFVEWEGSLKRSTNTPSGTPYRVGSLVNKWVARTEFIDNSQRFGIIDSSKGEK